MQYNPQTSLQTQESRQMGMFVHLAGLINTFAFPFGIIATVLLWQINKDKMPGLDAHGKMAVNWTISFLIYGLITFILAFVLIGFLLMPVLFIVGIAFPIIAGIKANNGELWEYPATIKFLK